MAHREIAGFWADTVPEHCSRALFKTPGLRDLGHSAPYVHTGAADSLQDVLRHDVRFSDLHSQGLVRKGDPALPKISLLDEDLPFLAAFLRSLNEDDN